MDEDEKTMTDEKEGVTEETKETQTTGAPSNEADYASILRMLTDMQANQDRLAGQIERISDAQSMILGAGAVIHEDSDARPGTPIKPPTDDDYVPLEQLNLSL